METFHGRDKGKRVRFGAFEVDFQGRELTRSEEHTSELQSQSNLVCRLLLEKKKSAPPAHSSHVATPPSSSLRRLVSACRVRPPMRSRLVAHCPSGLSTPSRGSTASTKSPPA